MRPLTPLILGSLLLLVGCSTSSPSDVAASETSESTSADGSETSPDEVDEDSGGDALPPGFPDPAALVGGELHTEFTSDGDVTVVDGEDTGLVVAAAMCFGGTNYEDVCDWSIQAAVLPGPEGEPEPTTAEMLFLLRSKGEMADGTPLWTVVDALVAVPPNGEPALLEFCEGEDGVAFYPDSDADLGATIPAAAAWAADADKTTLVGVDPAGLSCEMLGD